MNYLAESGESVDEMLDDIKTKWKQDAPSEDIRREELVAQTVKALEKLAKLFGKYMDEQRVAVQETTQERNQGGVRYSRKYGSKYGDFERALTKTEWGIFYS